MNFIQTLYINSDKDPFRDTFGWAAPEYHLMGWALSCLQLHETYGSITLFANKQAAHLLIDTLQLPYAEAYLTHDQLTPVHPDLWALSKIHTYSLQKQPFLHVDGDVFIFNPFDSRLLEGELIAQNVEVATVDYYSRTQKELMRRLVFFPPCVKRDFESGTPVQAANAGILGGNDVPFFHDYAALAFEYARRNAAELEHMDVNSFNVFLEQHLFHALAREKGIPVDVLFEGIVKDNGYRHVDDFHDVPFNRSYLHLLGHFKRDEFTCIRMAAKLKELHPGCYDRIITLFRNKKLRLSPCCFNNNTGQPSKITNEEDNSHLQLLRFVACHCPQGIDRELFQDDFEAFYQQLASLLKTIPTELMEARDLSAQHWYRDLFADSSAVLNQHIVRSRETEVIESAFNWAGLFNKRYRVGAGYYADLQVEKGRFFNLVVHEMSDNGFSLHDTDELDHAILLLLSEPLSIHELLNKMQLYFEDDVLQNHYGDYENLILASIRQLVIKKAVQPFCD